MRILFTTLQQVESDFYGRVGEELRRLGHDPIHLTYSRRAADVLRRRGSESLCLPDLMASVELEDPEREAARIEAEYRVPSTRSLYLPDLACERRSESWSIERTVRHFLAIERLFDDLAPEAVVPEVGTETMRTAAHMIGVRRGAPVLFLFYTIFPRPLRLYVDTMHASIVDPEELTEPSPSERSELDDFIARYKASGTPIRPYREPLTGAGARSLARHIVVKALWDGDNDYLRPGRWLLERFAERARSAVAGRFYTEVDSSRPYVYFPLHVTDDYKIKRLVPHCADQGSLVEQVALALPAGVDLVTKEHPMSVGRTPLSLIRRLSRIPNLRLVDPYTSSHDLIDGSRGVAVIGSTVGLEALLYDKPVLTLGQPFYAGMGVTLDVDSFRDLRQAVPELLAFRPDRGRIERFLHAANRRCMPGAPALVDRSDANAAVLAASLHQTLRTSGASGPARGPAGSSGRPAQPSILG